MIKIYIFFFTYFIYNIINKKIYLKKYQNILLAGLFYGTLTTTFYSYRGCKVFFTFNISGV
jgi:hypothetical protein